MTHDLLLASEIIKDNKSFLKIIFSFNFIICTIIDVLILPPPWPTSLALAHLPHSCPPPLPLPLLPFGHAHTVSVSMGYTYTFFD